MSRLLFHNRQFTIWDVALIKSHSVTTHQNICRQLLSSVIKHLHNPLTSTERFRINLRDDMEHLTWDMSDDKLLIMKFMLIIEFYCTLPSDMSHLSSPRECWCNKVFELNCCESIISHLNNSMANIKMFWTHVCDDMEHNNCDISDGKLLFIMLAQYLSHNQQFTIWDVPSKLFHIITHMCSKHFYVCHRIIQMPNDWFTAVELKNFIASSFSGTW